MRNLFFLLAFICSPAIAQITTESSPVTVIEAGESARIAGAYLVLPEGASPKSRPAVNIRYLGAESYSTAISASDAKREPVGVAEIGDEDYLIFGSGKVWVRLTAIDFPNQKFDVVETVVQIGSVIPDPDPDPEPDPDDDDDDTGPNPINAEWLIWIEEQQDRGNHPQSVSVMTSVVVRAAMADRGLTVRIYDDDQADVQRFVGYAGDIRPALIVYQDADNYRVFPAPKSADELESIVRENVIR